MRPPHMHLRKKSILQTATGISAPITAHGILSIKTLLPLTRERHQNPISGKNKLEIGINSDLLGIIQCRDR